MRQNNQKKFDDYSYNAKFNNTRNPNTQPVCYSCGLRSHKDNQCMKKSQDNKCYGCKPFGHVHFNCPRNSRKCTTKPDPQYSTANRTGNALSIQNLAKNLMHVDIKLTGIQLTTFCDTWS
ncbi:retrovirus-related Pol polyprotein from transposon 17.6 [Nephila pilipes]|uniref:Retrovirus-related Pol polyprotein from transposon 17.6 n=1 Tax=Nephila pilipes TaxID=299642 RepID=A0A8X6MDM7_NEPPI|nr:retrovirus-related Pol polyprotein from transposon 17.6 [Nephila pilipes]